MGVVPAHGAAVREQRPGLVGAALPGCGGIDVPPIYLKLAREMDLGISYALRAELPAEISGRYSVALTIQAGADGWMRSEALIAPTEFSGAEATFSVPLDLAGLAAEIEKVEEETGFSPTEYVVSLVPSIEVSGTIAGQPLEESIAPGFAMTLDTIQITPESPLSRLDPRPVTASFTVERDISLGGLAVPVAEGDERAPVDESAAPSAGDAGEDSPRERVPAP